MKKADLNAVEARLLLEREGVSISPSYTHKDYLYTSFTMPYPLKRKVDRISKKYNITRSKIVQMLIDTVDDDNFLNEVNIGR